MKKLLSALCLAALAAPVAAIAAPAELFFSEYIEGTGSNQALEIYNGTGSAIDLGAGQYSVQMFFDGSPFVGRTIDLSGSVAGGNVFVLARELAADAIPADKREGGDWFDGNDAVALLKDGVIIDVIGQIGVDPGSRWGNGIFGTADNTLRRKGHVEAGDTDGSDRFVPATQWHWYEVDIFDGLGSHSLNGHTGDGPAPAVLVSGPATISGAVVGQAVPEPGTLALLGLGLAGLAAARRRRR